MGMHCPGCSPCSCAYYVIRLVPLQWCQASGSMRDTDVVVRAGDALLNLPAGVTDTGYQDLGCMRREGEELFPSEYCSLVGLGNGRCVPREDAGQGFLFRGEECAPALELGFREEELYPPLTDIDLDLVPVMDERNGAPAAASGATCPMQGPRVPPENLPSVTSATRV